MTVYSQFERVMLNPELMPPGFIHHAAIVDIMQAKNGKFYVWIEVFLGADERETIGCLPVSFKTIIKMPSIDK